MPGLSKFDHRRRHIALHKAFDELLADFILHTGKLPSQTSIFDLMSWSFEQTMEPTEPAKPTEE